MRFQPVVVRYPIIEGSPRNALFQVGDLGLGIFICKHGTCGAGVVFNQIFRPPLRPVLPGTYCGNSQIPPRTPKFTIQIFIIF